MSKRKPKKKVRNVITVGLPGGPRTVAEALTKTNAGDVIVCAVKPHMTRGDS